MAEGQQHNRLPTPAHPLRSLFPPGSAGVPPAFTPPQWAASAYPQVVQPALPHFPKPQIMDKPQS